MRNSWGRALLILTLVLVAVGTVVWWQRPDVLARFGLSRHAGAPAEPRRAGRAPMAVPVEVAPAEAGRVADTVEALGTLAPNESVAVASEIAGRIVALRFEEGRPVEQGELLVELDATIARTELQQAQANLELAEDAFERNRTLVQRGAGTQVNLEQATAQLATARAAVASAQARLEKLTITAPFGGVVGLRSVSVGTLVQPGQAVASLTDLDPVKVDFRVPELFLESVRVGQRIDLTVDAIANRNFAGEVYAIDPVVDASGRAIRLRATVANADMALRPGLFARVVLTTGTRENAVSVLESAIVPASSGIGSALYVVEDGRARLVPVETGRRFAGRVEITSGLEAGASVVVAGQIRLRDGATVAATPARGGLSAEAPR